MHDGRQTSHSFHEGRLLLPANQIAIFFPAGEGALAGAFAIRAARSSCRGSFLVSLETTLALLFRMQVTNGYDADIKKQAEAVYSVYTSNTTDQGCLAQLCKLSSCGEPHLNIGQDEAVMERHAFCRGVWMADTSLYLERIDQLGGMNALQAACLAAGKVLCGFSSRPAHSSHLRLHSHKLTQSSSYQ